MSSDDMRMPKNSCTPVNRYTTKPVKSKRIHWATLHVLNHNALLSTTPSSISSSSSMPSRTTASASTVAIAKFGPKSKLFGPLQSGVQTVGAGQSFRLLCALTYANQDDRIEWTFVARPTGTEKSLAIALGAQTQLEIVNATQHQHDGVYNCSTSTDSQVCQKITLFFPLNYYVYVFKMVWIELLFHEFASAREYKDTFCSSASCLFSV